MDISIENYLRHATIHAECTLSGDYKTGNRSATEIERMNKFIVELENDDSAYNIIDEILNSDCTSAIMWIAPVCIKRNYKMGVIKRRMIAFSNDKKLGILALDAAMLLKTYNE